MTGPNLNPISRAIQQRMDFAYDHLGGEALTLEASRRLGIGLSREEAAFLLMEESIPATTLLEKFGLRQYAKVWWSPRPRRKSGTSHVPAKRRSAHA